MFTDDIKGTFTGRYINNGGSVTIPNPVIPNATLGIDVTNTVIDKKTNQSTTGITINGSLGLGPQAEGHFRIGTTNSKVTEKKELIDFNPIIKIFKDNDGTD